MKINKTLTLFSILAQASFAAATPVDVYILSGQSNMSGRVTSGFVANSSIDNDVLYYYTTDGPASNDVTTNGSYTNLGTLATGYYGPEISFARTLHPESDNKIAVIKITDGGTNLQYDWNSRSTSGTNYLWQTWEQDTTEAIEALEDLGYTPSIKGISWLQGESGSTTFATSGGYESTFANLIDDMNSHLGGLADTSDMKIVTALIQNRSEKTYATREAQKNVMATNPNWFTVDTDDLTTFDGTHFDQPSVVTIGERVADAFIAAQGGGSNETVSSATVSVLEDSYVRGGSFANTSYGSANTLRAKLGSSRFTRRSFLKFDVSNLGEGTSSLILNPSRVPSAGITVQLYGVNDAWSEGSLTWNNQPATQTLLQTFDIVASDLGGSLSIDVSDYVAQQAAGDGVASFAVYVPSSSALLEFTSKESGTPSTLEFEGDAPSTPTVTPMELSVSADSYVRGGSFAAQNYGTMDHFRVKYSTTSKFVREGYMKFDISNLEVANQVNLVLPVASNSGAGTVELYAVSNNSWSETSLTWSNKPATSSRLATFNITAADAGQEIAIDVTDYVMAQSGNDVSFCLKASAGSGSVMRIESKEAGTGVLLDVQ